jgi:hypothetical protein
MPYMDVESLGSEFIPYLPCPLALFLMGRIPLFVIRVLFSCLGQAVLLADRLGLVVKPGLEGVGIKPMRVMG